MVTHLSAELLEFHGASCQILVLSEGESGLSYYTGQLANVWSSRLLTALTMCAAAYPGAPLGQGEDQTRLLTVLAGLPGDPIDCVLSNHAIGEISTAEAVSYAWGGTAGTKSILVNGSPFHVGENLFQALVHLRLPATHRLLWIDAVCINQSDTSERNHQVQKMAAIYSGANRVLVWLGLETENSKAAFEFLRAAYQRSPYNREELMHHKGWLVLEELCSREYWTRVWIVQEICLASRLILCCGTSQIPWVYLSELRQCRKNVWPRYMSKGEQAFMRSLPARIDQQKESRNKNRGCSLWALLEAFQSSKCKEVHDKVYGFLGLSTDCGSSGIPIDYSRSVQQLYNDVILFYHQRFRNKSGPPSAAQLISLSEFLQQSLGCQFDATPQHGFQHPVTASDQLLETNAGSTDVVEVSAFSTLVVDKFLSSSDAANYNAIDLLRFLNGEIPYSHLGFWRDFIDHRVSGVFQVGPCQASLIFHEKITAFGDEQEVEAISQPSVFIARPVTQNVNLREDKTTSKAEFVIGIAPPGTRRGDLVCTFVDSRVVLIVRPCPHTANGVDRAKQIEKTTPQPDRRVLKPVIGRAVIDLSRSTWLPPFKSDLNLDKTIQVTRVRSLVDEREAPWPATLVIDLPSLQRLTSSKLELPPMRTAFSATLDLLPIREPSAQTGQFPNICRPSSPDDLTVAEGKRAASDNVDDPSSFVDFEGHMDDDEMARLRENPELRRHALGPGYGGIKNLGSTGYLSCALQLFYMIKPVREVSHARVTSSQANQLLLTQV